MAGLEVRSTVKFNPSLIWLLLAVRPPWRRTAREREDAGVGRPSGSTLGDAKAEAVAALAALALSADPAGSFDVLFALLFRVVWLRSEMCRRQNFNFCSFCDDSERTLFGCSSPCRGLA